MPIGHGMAMSFTRDAVLFQSRVRRSNSEVGAQIYGLPNLTAHAGRSSSSSVASAIYPTSPRGARLQLTRCRKGMKTKKQRDRRTAEIVRVVLNFFSVQLSLGRPRGRLEPAARQACPWLKVGVGTTRPDSPCHSMRRLVISRGGGVG
ncbi:hypothetical protein L3X38_011923 [Prunus dulcis]|uniref:Uncharacterized protein n=1 Tax=Prunus dulcis TaxID=3755 RepID=A0AAD4ZFW1_PRUDU|nr:hypothetical protein L3X38_011923 [Prunus dulcis]